MGVFHLPTNGEIMRLLTLRVAMLSHLAFTASMSKRVACVGFVAAPAAGPLWAKEDPGDKTILNHMTFWRQHYTLDGPVMRKGEDLEKIKLISAGKEVAKWLGFETAAASRAGRGQSSTTAAGSVNRFVSQSRPG